MGLLDQKERVYDVVLTDLGRRLLSKNQLQIEHYAFSDEGINYSGSLSASLAQSSSLDDFVHNNLPFEAGQRKNQDLKSFLFTNLSREETLPQFVANVDVTGTLSLTRRYVIDELLLNTANRSKIKDPIAIVARVVVEKEDSFIRTSNFVSRQRLAQALSLFEENRNLLGANIGNGFVVIGEREVIQTQDGSIRRFEPGNRRLFTEVANRFIGFSKDIEVVTGLDRQKIDLSLQNKEDEVDTQNGFLVEVFLSGTDGKLTRVNRNDLINPANDNMLEEGFGEFLDLRLDVEDDS